MIKAVIFDMDGLMFDTETLNMEGWKFAGKLHGYDMPEDLIRAHIGANAVTTRKLMQEHFGANFDFDAVRRDRIDHAFRYIKKHGMPLKPGLQKLLAYLKEKNIKTAIGSSSEERFVRFYLEHADLDHTFDVVVCGDMVDRSKPEPDIFLLALERLGVAAEQCLVLEDSYNGIIAAHRAGIRCVMIPDLLPPTPETEKLLFRRVHSLTDVIDLIEELHS